MYTDIPSEPTEGFSVEGPCESLDNASDAAFILKMTAEYNLGEAAIEDIISSVCYMCKEKLEAKCKRQCTLDPQTFSATLLKKVDTNYKCDTFFRKTFCLVKPGEIVVGTSVGSVKRKGKYRFQQKPAYGYVVPFLEQLAVLLNMPEVEHSESEICVGMMIDVTHGTYSYYCPLVKQHPDCIRIALYSDNVEIVNSIGLHCKKHKLCFFYYSVLNIDPALYTHKAQAIQMLAVMKPIHVKQNRVSKLLASFKDERKKLYSRMEMTIGGEKRVVHCLVLYYTGNTLAAQAAGGFKEGVGFAHKPCRTCQVKHDNWSESWLDEKFKKRTLFEHNERVLYLDPTDHAFWSKEYGVNGPRMLSDIPGFDVTSCLLHDPMHVLREGVHGLVLKLLLSYLISDQHYFTLSTLNLAITYFSYIHLKL